ncbi:MAG: type II secretion system GspH family protein [Tenericutes bacterium]|nr:type II secretion system GspH family protein [Mycoplasmatota bacterium]
MNKKGFTLVEIIAVIVLLVTIGGIFTVSMVRKLNDKENNKDTVKQIISAADAYVSANKEEIEKLYEGYNFVDITIKDLKNNGLLNDDIIDSNTNEKYSDDEKVRITLNGSTGTVEFTISPEEKDNTYLIADDILFKA